MIKRAAAQYILPGDSSAFGGQNALLKRHQGKLSLSSAKRVLSSNFAHSLHRERRKPKYRNNFFLYYRRQQIQIDLFELLEFAKDNDGVKYLSAAIDGATKRLCVRAMVDKTARSSLAAIKSMFEEMGDDILSVHFDRGAEFRNSLVRNYLLEAGVKIAHNHSEVKAAIVERAGKSLQRLIYAFMTENTTRRYIHMLQSLVDTYNNRPHRSLGGMTPNEADLHENRHRLISALGEKYAPTVLARNKKRKTFEVGDVVRIEMETTKFSRSYREQFSRELFRVVGIENRMPIPTYNVQSLEDGEVVLGSFYASQLALVTKELI